MLSSAEFVEALGRLGYPDASSLKPSDFDWAFDSTPENHDFLHFICRTLDKRNVITPEEARAFQELKKSDKPILDEAALSKVLKTLEPSEENSLLHSDPGPRVTSATCDPEVEMSIEELEEELQALIKEKALKERRCNKLQVFATSREDVDQRLAAELERAKSKLSEANASIEEENTDTNALLESLTDKLRQLGSHLAKNEGPGQEGECASVAQSASSASKKHPVLLCQLNLDPFLQLDETHTKKLSLLLRSPLDKGVSELFDTSSTEDSKVDLTSHEDLKETDMMEEEECLLDHKRTEMARIQWSYMVAQYQLIRATAEEKSLMAGIKWLSKFSPTTDLSNSFQDMTEDSLVNELRAAEVKLEQMLRDEGILALLRDSARSLSVPVISGDLDIQMAKYEDYSSVQSQVIDFLLQRRASLELIRVALGKELKKWTSYHSDLEKLRNKLVKDGEEASLRMECLAHPDLALSLNPNPVITSKDAAFSRLLHLLENVSSHNRPDPLQTFGALDEAAQTLSSSLESKKTSFDDSTREQQDVAARLGAHCEALHQALYTELRHLFLGPQAHPVATTDKDFVFPNAHELTSQLFETETRLQSLQQQMQEILQEVKAKHSELEHKRFLKQERELYVHFNLNPEKMEKIVVDVESKATKKGVQK